MWFREQLESEYILHIPALLRHITSSLCLLKIPALLLKHFPGTAFESYLTAITEAFRTCPAQIWNV